MLEILHGLLLSFWLSRKWVRVSPGQLARTTGLIPPPRTRLPKQGFALRSVATGINRNKLKEVAESISFPTFFVADAGCTQVVFELRKKGSYDIPGFTMCGVGGALLLCGLMVLSWIDQDDARHRFGHTGGFICPFVLLLPIACILINVYLLINLGAGTWIRVSAWMVVGVFVYLFYRQTHVEEIYCSSSDYLA